MIDVIVDEVRQVREELIKRYGGIEGYFKHCQAQDQARPMIAAEIPTPQTACPCTSQDHHRIARVVSYAKPTQAVEVRKLDPRRRLTVSHIRDGKTAGTTSERTASPSSSSAGGRGPLTDRASCRPTFYRGIIHQGSLDMFNLLVSFDGTAWETDQVMRMPTVRFKEYSGFESEAISVREPQTLRLLENIDSLLMYESGSHGN